MKIYCCCCEKTIDAILVTGEVVYPFIPRLHNDNFYQCPKCKNFVGTHNKDKTHKNYGKPLGTIPTPEIRDKRKKLHRLIDEIKNNKRDKYLAKQYTYKLISKKIGKDYHTAEINSIEEADKVIEFLINDRKMINEYIIRSSTEFHEKKKAYKRRT